MTEIQEGSEVARVMTFRIERVEYAEIEVNVDDLAAEWGDDLDGQEREDIIEVLYKIGVRDLMYSGDFIEVAEKNTEETIT